MSTLSVPERFPYHCCWDTYRGKLKTEPGSELLGTWHRVDLKETGCARQPGTALTLKRRAAPVNLAPITAMLRRIFGLALDAAGTVALQQGFDFTAGSEVHIPRDAMLQAGRSDSELQRLGFGIMT